MVIDILTCTMQKITKTKTKYLILYLLVIILSSCVKMPKREEPLLPPSPVGSIPYDFDWKTVKTINITINVTSSGDVFSSSNHIIKIYNSPLLNTGSLIATGAAKPGAPFLVNISLSTPTEYLYIHETKPNGLTSVTQVQVNSTSINTTLTKSTQESRDNNMPFASNAPSAFTFSDITIPTQYDVIVNNNSTLNIVGFNTGQTSAYGNLYKSYLIPAGFTRTANIGFGNYLQHAVLYVQGSLNINSQADLNKMSIVILSGGSVTVKGLTTGVIEAAFPVIYIQSGASFTSSEIVNISNATLVNKGSITTSKKIDINNRSNFYNEGSLQITGSNNELHITNFGAMFNSGPVNVPKISVTTNGTFNNAPKAVVTAVEWYQTNGSVLNNHGEVAATTKFSNSGGGTVNNFCLITANVTDFQQMTANLEPGSLWNSQSFAVNNSTINMVGGSMFLTARITDIYGFNVISSSASYSLFKSTGSVPAFTWAATSFRGNIEFVYTGLTAANRSSYESSLSNGAILGSVQTKNIKGTSCNGSLGQIEEDNDPGTTPTFASYFPSQSGWATYAFEDQWPLKGDYDLNDLVVRFRLTTLHNSSNQVVELLFDYSVLAVGATKSISAAFQLDNILASAVSSVTGQIAGGSTPFGISPNGTETGASKAIIPVFNNAKNIVPFSGYLNTVKGEYTPTPYNQVRVIFSAPVNQSLISMSSFNFFISVDSRGLEIHLPGYSATQKFNSSLGGSNLHPSDMFKYSDGMMWALMFPADFSYSAEGNSIAKAYKHFAAWAVSGGVEYPDWYMDKTGYRDNELIY